MPRFLYNSALLLALLAFRPLVACEIPAHVFVLAPNPCWTWELVQQEYGAVQKAQWKNRTHFLWPPLPFRAIPLTDFDVTGSLYIEERPDGQAVPTGTVIGAFNPALRYIWYSRKHVLEYRVLYYELLHWNQWLLDGQKITLEVREIGHGTTDDPLFKGACTWVGCFGNPGVFWPGPPWTNPRLAAAFQSTCQHFNIFLTEERK